MLYSKSGESFHHLGDCEYWLYLRNNCYFLEVPILVGQIIWSRKAEITKEQFEQFLLDDAEAIMIANQLTETGNKEARAELDRH